MQSNAWIWLDGGLAYIEMTAEQFAQITTGDNCNMFFNEDQIMTYNSPRTVTVTDSSCDSVFSNCSDNIVGWDGKLHSLKLLMDLYCQP